MPTRSAQSIFLACGTAAFPFGRASFPEHYPLECQQYLARYPEEDGSPIRRAVIIARFQAREASELQTTGSQWATAATLGDCRSLAFKGYVDLANELSRDLSRLLDEDLFLGEEAERDD